jgi:8-oxo-dGTP pyrophosphatase MutT (NUDIX family)
MMGPLTCASLGRLVKRMGSANEIVAIVDRNNNLTGKATRQEMRSKGLTHRATYILVLNSVGQLFVQKRTTTKDIYPGCYDPAAGGVVLDGETYDQGAYRELEEEMGICGVLLEQQFDFFFEEENLRVWGRVFSCIYDGPLNLQVEEVQSGSFMSIPDILTLAAREPFAGDGLEAFRKYLGHGDLSRH